MKLEISKLKLLWKLLTGGAASVASYVLDLINNALAGLDASDKASVQAVLNFATKALATLNAFAWLIPTKWQTAYLKTIVAVQSICNALDDLTLTVDELTQIRDDFAAAVAAWNGDDEDDETCKDCEPTDDETCSTCSPAADCTDCKK